MTRLGWSLAIVPAVLAAFAPSAPASTEHSAPSAPAAVAGEPLAPGELRAYSNRRTRGGACLPRLAEGAGGCCAGGVASSGLVAALWLGYFRAGTAIPALNQTAPLPLLYGTSVATWTACAAWGVHATGEWIRTGRPNLAPSGRRFERTLVWAGLGTIGAVIGNELRIYATSGSLARPRRSAGSWFLAIPFVTVAFASYGYETADLVEP